MTIMSWLFTHAARVLFLANANLATVMQGAVRARCDHIMSLITRIFVAIACDDEIDMRP
ncbi:MAG: hypothetical protein IT497_09825 [Ottowia sp.]|nr:hypothetical protein [Ottowia sp.]